MGRQDLLRRRPKVGGRGGSLQGGSRMTVYSVTSCASRMWVCCVVRVIEIRGTLYAWHRDMLGPSLASVAAGVCVRVSRVYGINWYVLFYHTDAQRINLQNRPRAAKKPRHKKSAVRFSKERVSLKIRGSSGSRASCRRSKCVTVSRFFHKAPRQSKLSRTHERHFSFH